MHSSIQGVIGILIMCYLTFTAMACCFWMGAAFPLLLLGEKYHLAFEVWIQETFLIQVVWCIEVGVNIKIRQTGEKPTPEAALVLPNHQTHDWVVMYSMAIRMGTLGLVRTIIKKAIAYVPGFGWGMYFAYWPFVSRNYKKDVSVLGKLFGSYKRHNMAVQLWLYAEGTRLTPAKLKDSQEYAKSKGYPVWNNVMLPKHRGFMLAADSLKGVVSTIHELALGYEGWGKPPGLWDIITTPRDKPHVMHVHLKRTPLEDVPADEEGKKQWLMESFARKEVLLEEFKTTGKFPGPEQIGKFAGSQCVPYLIGWLIASCLTYYGIYKFFCLIF